MESRKIVLMNLFAGEQWRLRASQVGQLVNNLPAMQETWVQSLGWEDPLEEGMATTPIFLPGESLWTKEPKGESMGLQRIGHN